LLTAESVGIAAFVDKTAPEINPAKIRQREVFGHFHFGKLHLGPEVADRLETEISARRRSLQCNQIDKDFVPTLKTALWPKPELRVGRMDEERFADGRFAEQRARLLTTARLQHRHIAHLKQTGHRLGLRR